MVDEVRLTKPHVRVVRNADRTYNFQDLVDEALAQPPSEGPPPKFAVFNIQLLDGRIDIDDRAEEEKHEVADLRIGIPFISSLPAHVEVKVAPELAAKVNGAPLAVKGETQPFHETHVTTLNVNLDDFDLTRLVDYLPFKLRAKVKSALLDTRLLVAFEQRDGKAPQIKVRRQHGSEAGERTRPRGPPDARVAASRHRDQRGRRARAGRRPEERRDRDARRACAARQVGRDQPGESCRRRRRRRGAAAEARARPAPRRYRSRSGRSRSSRGKVRFTDETTAPTFETVLEVLDVEGREIDNAKGKRSEWRVSTRTDAAETLKLTAGLVRRPAP